MTSHLVRPAGRLFLLALLAACSDDAPDGVKIPATGGTVTADSARLTLVVPAGALREDTHIDVRAGAAPSDPTLVGDRSYVVAPGGLRLATPATVTVRPAAALPTGVARDELAIAVSVDGAVAEVPATLDAGAGTVSAPLSTLGDLWVRRLHVDRVSLDRAAAQLDAGRTLQLRASALAAGGRTLQSPAVTWSSDNQAVALVGPQTGLVSAGAAGTARITARSEGKEASVTVTVVRRSVQTIQLVVPQPTLVPAQTTQLTAVLRDSVGDPIERLPTFVSQHPDVAQVQANGTVVAMAPGVATIDATADGATARTFVTVRPTPVRITGVREMATGGPAPLNALVGSVAVDVAVNPDRIPRHLALRLDCPGRPEATIATLPYESAAGQTLSLAFHSGEYDEATGHVRTPNGSCQLRAQLEYAVGAADAAAPLAVTLANPSRFIARTSVSDTRTAVLGIAPVARAQSTNDLLDRVAGSVTLDLLALSYAPESRLASITGTFLGRTFTGVAPAAGTHRFVLQFPNVPTTSNALGIAGYTSPTGGDVPVIGAVAITGGAPFATVQATALRVDNGAPQPPALFTLAGATTIGGQPWVPATYTFDRAQVYQSAGDTVSGVGGTRVEFHGQRTTEAGLPNGSATGADCAAGTLVKVATAGDLRALRPAGAAAAANEFRIRAVEWDRLGNIRCTDLATTFGVTEP